MAWVNYHGHCELCDGTGDPEAYVEAALDRGFPALGFSSHAPLPFAAPWCLGRGMDAAALDSYRKAIAGLKRSFRGLIGLWAGLEVDWIPGLMGPGDPAFASFDYRIGSVHFVGRRGDGGPWQMDDNPEAFASGADRLFGGDVRALATAYYDALCDMLRSGPPDIVGHFDLVKKFNRGGRFFDEGATWYRELVMRSLAVVSESGAMLELNTGGMSRGWSDIPYPSPWILPLCRDAGIRIVISSDCHRSQDIDFGFRDAADMLLSAGITEVMVLGEEGWEALSFDRGGLLRRPMVGAA